MNPSRSSLLTPVGMPVALVLLIATVGGCAARVNVIERTDRPLNGYSELLIRPLANTSGDKVNQKVCLSLMQDVAFRLRRNSGVIDIRVDPFAYTDVLDGPHEAVGHFSAVPASGRRRTAELRITVLKYESADPVRQALSIGFAGQVVITLDMQIVDGSDGEILVRGETTAKIGGRGGKVITVASRDADAIVPLSKAIDRFVDKEFIKPSQ